MSSSSRAPSKRYEPTPLQWCLFVISNGTILKGLVVRDAQKHLHTAWPSFCSADKLCSGHAATIQGQHEEGHWHGA